MANDKIAEGTVWKSIFSTKVTIYIHYSNSLTPTRTGEIKIRSMLWRVRIIEDNYRGNLY